MPELQDSDPFELELLGTDFRSDADVARLEEKLGLSGGGCWWLDPSQVPVELDSSGNRIEGAIADEEAQARTWLRSSFDNNPNFREHSYHLLSRLTELARLKGLVEEVALKQHQANAGSTDRAENPLFHSTLSLAGLAEVNGFDSWQSGAYPIPNESFDLHRSVEGPLGSQANYETYVQKHPKWSHGKRPQLPEAFTGSLGLSQESNVERRLYPSHASNGDPQAINSMSTPRPKKSDFPPSPHHNQLAPPFGYTKRPPSRNSNRTRHHLAVPDATSSPDQAANGQQPSGMLNRTYSKEALDLLKEQDFMPARRSGGSINSSLLQPFLSRNGSGRLSDADSDVDVSRSMEQYAPGALSLSLSDAHFGSLRGSRGNPNASYSSMRITDVIEVARMQESKLRQHSGSRGKLNGSNSSLTGSLVAEDGLLRPDTSKNRSQSSLNSAEIDLVRGSLDGGLLRRVSPRSLNNSIDPSRSVDLTDRSNEPLLRNRNNSAADITDVSRHPEPLQIQDNIKADVESHLISEASTPIFDASKITNSTHGSVMEPSTVTHKTKDPGIFFPDNVDQVVPRTRTTSPVPRLDSQTSFEQLEARVSQETFLLGPRSSTDEDVNVTDSISSLEHVIGSSVPEPTVAVSKSSSSIQLSSNASSKESLTAIRPPSGLRPPSRLPAPVRRLPAPSLHPPTLSSRIRPGFTQPSGTHSTSSDRTSRQPMSQIQPQNANMRNTLSGASKRPDTRLPMSKPISTDHSSRSNIRPPSRPSSAGRPQVSRSDASPVRSTSRRFGLHSNTQGTRRN